MWTKVAQIVSKLVTLLTWIFCLYSAALLLLNYQQLFYLFGQIQTRQTGGQPYSDTSPFSKVFKYSNSQIHSGWTPKTSKFKIMKDVIKNLAATFWTMSVMTTSLSTFIDVWVTMLDKNCKSRSHWRSSNSWPMTWKLKWICTCDITKYLKHGLSDLHLQLKMSGFVSVSKLKCIFAIDEIAVEQ